METRNIISDASIALILEDILHNYRFETMCILYLIAARTRSRACSRRAAARQPFTIISRMPSQVKQMDRLVGVTDVDCVNKL